jgi:DNA-binding beta-propeller fold protein YncE
VSLPLAAVLAGGASAATGSLPRATTFRACAGAGDYWPTMTLALERDVAWVACKEEGRVVRLSLRRGRVDATVRLGAPAIAVASGLGAVWALDGGSTLTRIRPSNARPAARIAVGASAPYNVWIGGGSVWVADDEGAAVIRVAPATNAVVARIPVGDGPSSIAFSQTAAWVICHRDRRLFRVDLATNAVSELRTVPGDAPERLALLGGSLWITGRGTDLLRADPATGEVTATYEIGAGGIDVVAAAGALWVPARNAAVDRRGFPTMAALRRVSAATGRVTTVAVARGRVDVHGLRALGGHVWLADNTAGLVYRLPA